MVNGVTIVWVASAEAGDGIVVLVTGEGVGDKQDVRISERATKTMGAFCLGIACGRPSPL
jgi:hypothetical protein